ncbi:MAG: CvpA family protein, partial [Verrucomicrobiae bacterium]|nr:CvpA family protein [Verrucomicrobiae bacterium]
MTWLIALLLLAGCAAVGYNQGAIRAGFSFVGLLVAAFVAMPLGQPLRKLCPSLGIEEPLWVAVAPHLAAFVLVLAVFKGAAQFVHRKVYLYYKYKAGELRRALWERLNSRLGLCIGLANGAIYFVLLAMVLYPVTYLTTQTASEENDPKLLKLLNATGWDMQKTRLSHAAAALAPVPTVFYDIADLVGLIHQNPLLYGLVSRYPALLQLAEQPEFGMLADEEGVGSLLLRRAPINELIQHPSIQGVFKNRSQLETLWSQLGPNLNDFRAYLESGGDSPKYGAEKILGKWQFDNYGSIAALKRTTTNLTASYLRFMRQTYYPAARKVTLLATPDHKVYLREFVRLNQPPVAAGRRGTPGTFGQPTP